jgi:hypothetical protein
MARFLAGRRDTTSTTSDRNSRSLYFSLIILCRLALIHVLFLGLSVSASFVVPNLLGHRLLNLSYSSVRFNQSVSMNRPTCLNSSASGRRPVAYTLPILELLFNFVPVGYLPLPPVLRRQVHSSLGLPRTCPVLSVVALMFPVRPKSFIPRLLFIRHIAVV